MKSKVSFLRFYGITHLRVQGLVMLVGLLLVTLDSWAYKKQEINITVNGKDDIIFTLTSGMEIKAI